MGSVILEQFHQSLLEDTRVWLKQHQSVNLDIAVKFMEEFMQGNKKKREEP